MYKKPDLFCEHEYTNLIFLRVHKMRDGMGAIDYSLVLRLLEKEGSHTAEQLEVLDNIVEIDQLYIKYAEELQKEKDG